MASTETPARTHIDSITAFFLLGVALMIDFLQMVLGFVVFIPILGLMLAPILVLFISIFAWMLFYFWFNLLGVNLWDKTVIWIIGPLAELTPLGILPLWTAIVALTIVITRARDKV